MSYDIYFFQMRDGITIDQVNGFLETDEFKEYCDKMYDEDENTEDEEGPGDDDGESGDPPLIPERFINVSLSEEELQKKLFRAYLKTAAEEAGPSEELSAFVSGGDEIPDELQGDFMDLFEYGGVRHMQPMMFSYGRDVSSTLNQMVAILEALLPERIACYDPQAEKIVDGTNAREVFSASGEQSKAEFDLLMAGLQAGAFELSAEEDDDDEDFDDADDFDEDEDFDDEADDEKFEEEDEEEDEHDK